MIAGSSAGATQPTGAAIAVQGLVKQFGQVRAVDRLSMSVDKGSIYGFVGPNGAGKTTTMRILSTLLEADDGTCSISGLDVRSRPAQIRALLGYMPDFFGVYDDLTVQEYLEFYAEAYSVPVRVRKTTLSELLELVDLTEKRDAYVESLSRGMKQRLGLARCLVHDPQVLLLDEPASGMDPRARYEMREIVKELRRMGKTVLLSSHILLELAEICTHIGIVQKGKLIRQGLVADILGGINAGRRIELRAIATRDAVESFLRIHPDVATVEHFSEPVDGDILPDSGICTVAFHTLADDKALRDLLRALVDGGVGVVSYAPIRDNLEEVFLQLTSDDAAGTVQ
jgi:ABC-2 type transport system ATP-binding protein